jgi:DNA-binding HxlR family transcriptional regulator/putative sterol carrier protein
MRPYGQWCALAKALEIVGERWSLLVVRELLDGPRRYTDLLDGIPGISTDVLAARLRDLEDGDVLVRRTLPPPASSKVYELTERGHALAPSVGALATWGMQLLGERTEDEAFRPHWIASGLRALLRPDRARDVRLDIDFVLGASERVRIRVDGGRLASVPEPDREPDLVVHAEVSTLAALADGSARAGDAIADGRLELDGGSEAIRAYGRLFPQPAA